VFALERVKPFENTAQPVNYDKLLTLSNYASGGATCIVRGHDCSQGHDCHPVVCRHDCPWPEVIVCASVNISDLGATPPGRSSMSFTFTGQDIGVDGREWVQTKAVQDALGRRRREDITLPAAVAIAGAAISPAMGKMTKD